MYFRDEEGIEEGGENDGDGGYVEDGRRMDLVDDLPRGGGVAAGGGGAAVGHVISNNNRNGVVPSISTAPVFDIACLRELDLKDPLNNPPQIHGRIKRKKQFNQTNAKRTFRSPSTSA